VIKRHGSGELESVISRSLSTPALAGSGAIGKPSVESMRRLDFMRVIMVLASFAFFASQKDASMKADGLRLVGGRQQKYAVRRTTFFLSATRSTIAIP
jgi:hypothetical protein